MRDTAPRSIHAPRFRLAGPGARRAYARRVAGARHTVRRILVRVMRTSLPAG
ncbi:MAG: hypothetical protein IT486_00690 [Gammaproteobacteria bacterium]|nr:hypothetical protein [Gammaproteobacteria bacterium]